MRSSLAVLLALGAAGIPSAQATSAACIPFVVNESHYLNVSSAGWASREEPLVACSIINPEVGNQSATAVFVETQTEDAVLAVKYTDKPFPEREADDWQQDLTESQRQPLALMLRAPGRPSDAALLLHVDQALYPPDNAVKGGYRFGMCVYGYPKSGRAWTTVSISSMPRSPCHNWNPPPLMYFEH